MLIDYLQQVAKDFEMISDEMEDKNLKNTFAALSEEDKQFAAELGSLAKQQGFIADNKQAPLLSGYSNELYNEDSAISKNNELLHICDKSEYIFLKLYSDALNEFLSFNYLTTIMTYQYNSIRTGFLKLRMLNSIRFSH